MATYTGLARLGRKPELRYTPEGQAVMNLSLAFSYGRKGDGGKRPATWVDASMWGEQAKAVEPYLDKGSAVVVCINDLHIEAFKLKDGTPSQKLAGRVLTFEFAGGPTQQERAPAPQTQRAPPPKTAATSTGFDDMDDDIPF